MIRRRLVPLALLVTALLAVVALAARGRPLGTGGGRSSGLPSSFWDFLFTTVVIVALLLVVAAVVGLVVLRPEQRMQVASYERRTLRTILVLIAAAALIAFVARHVDLHHLLRRKPTKPTGPTGASGKGRNGKPPPPNLHFQWEELVIVLAILLALGVAAWVTRSRLDPGGRRRRRPAPETLAAAFDESLDDLRHDPDLRRAIIAAYARMEIALGAAGIPRDPPEAPLEYVERALLNLQASASDVRRLTDLFEWARFSHHEPEPSMRDEAIDALVAVRDELRAAELTPA